MAFELHISMGSSVPIFRQIVDQVRIAAATGALSTGDALPSVRALAERLVINPNTVAKAYAELCRMAVIETRPGKGAVIAAQRHVYTDAERRRRLAPAMNALVREAISLGFSPTQAAELLDEAFKRVLNAREG